jgi:hypothetical protein
MNLKEKGKRLVMCQRIEQEQRLLINKDIIEARGIVDSIKLKRFDDTERRIELRQKGST